MYFPCWLPSDDPPLVKPAPEECWVCGQPGVLRDPTVTLPHRRYNCESCDVYWGPVKARPRKPKLSTFVTNMRGEWEEVPYINHAEVNLPAPA